MSQVTPAENMPTKICKKCNIEQNISEFFTFKSTENGKTYYEGKCKKCKSIEDCIRRRSIPKDLNKERIYKSRKKNPDSARRAVKNHVKKNPQAYYSRCLLNAMIRSGMLRRVTICEKCGSRGKIQAHHTDYNKPLYVEWLCTSCHGETRRRILLSGSDSG